jgi:hypothetical protein
MNELGFRRVGDSCLRLTDNKKNGCGLEQFHGGNKRLGIDDSRYSAKIWRKVDASIPLVVVAEAVKEKDRNKSSKNTPCSDFL